MFKTMIKSISSIGLLVLVAFVFGYAAYATSEQFVENNRWVIHTNQVFTQTTRVQAYLFEADGYFLRHIVTKQERFMTEFNHQIDRTRRELEQLANMIKDNPIQENKIKELVLCFEKRIKYQKEVVIPHPEKAGEPESNQLRHNITTVIESINREESLLLTDRFKQVEKSAFLLSFVIGFGSLILTGLAFNAGAMHNEAVRRFNLNKFMDQIKK